MLTSPLPQINKIKIKKKNEKREKHVSSALPPGKNLTMVVLEKDIALD